MTTATLPPDILARLHGDGVTPRWLAEHLRIGVQAASRLLRATGATSDNAGRYRHPSRKRNDAARRALEVPACSTGSWGVR